MPPAQTIAQAKASFKARGRPSLTDKEQRQLQRACELAQRAERLKEQEKKRAAASAKRKLDGGQDARERQKALLGTQRKKDKFGYKSSQFHLGAFLKVGGQKDDIKSGPTVVMEDAEDEDFFEDEDLDDETMLGASEAEPIASASHQKKQPETVKQSHTKTTLMLPPPLPRPRTSHKPPQPAQVQCEEEDLSSFWDDLDSSTQVARELKSGKTPPLDDPPSSLNTSFGSGSFDLSAEELDKLDPPMTAAPIAKSRFLPAPAVTMPPPLLPSKEPTVSSRTLAPSKRVQDAPVKQPKRQNAIRGPFLPATSLYCSSELGFTMTQLESFVDDDIQLTQAVLG